MQAHLGDSGPEHARKPGEASRASKLGDPQAPAGTPHSLGLLGERLGPEDPLEAECSAPPERGNRYFVRRPRRGVQNPVRKRSIDWEAMPERAFPRVLLTDRRTAGFCAEVQ